jgi:WD40 repeat protein
MTVFDINRDGLKEVIYGTYEGQVFCFDVNAKRLIYEFVGGPVTDIWAGTLKDGDVDPCIVVTTKRGDITVLDAKGKRLRFVDIKKYIKDLEVADVNNDGAKEILVAVEDGTVRVFLGDLRIYACLNGETPAVAVKAAGKKILAAWDNGVVRGLEISKRNPISGGIHY